MGLIVDVYTQAGGNYDCTAGGISSQFASFCLVNVDGPFQPKSNCPPALLMAGNQRGTLKIVPAVEIEKGVYNALKKPNANGPMMGGNYAATSDSRFSEACERILGNRFYGAVAVHDRFEY